MTEKHREEARSRELLKVPAAVPVKLETIVAFVGAAANEMPEL